MVNYAWAAWDEPSAPPAYAFTPLPVAVTAVEGLKQLDYFLYQSADDERQWRRDGIGELALGLPRTPQTVQLESTTLRAAMIGSRPPGVG